MKITEKGTSMMKTLRNMIIRKKDDLDKPNLGSDEKDFEPGDDYHIPEPDDIRRLPNPGFQEPHTEYAPGPYEQGYPREAPVQTQRPYYQEQRPVTSPEPRPYYGRSIEDQVREILYRIEDIERRLARLEGYQPQPRRY